ncbi:efflux RND transporter periplasmic adaptor subunit [Dendrosporobacter sp. 1207_IL3150]|uniref:efflux RND transporter periplasmic adaptor subunit n=1 Tax=Dendrosporobacter sp. 1207_IL3150 TaxID=3084054 RepID=UPI002FD99CCB
MLDNLLSKLGDTTTKKRLLVGAVLGALVAGSFGYYTYYHKKPAMVDHSAHQGPSSVEVAGDVVKLDAKARQLAGVQTSQVVSKQLNKEIKTTGKVAFNESGRTYITSRVEGRIDELYINADGDYIAPGQAIAAVYSPTYIAAQEEYLLAIDTVNKLRGASKDIAQLNNKLLQAAKRKLELLGVPSDDIAHLEHTRQPNTHMLVRAQFGGTVLEKLLLPGGYIMPGDKLFTLSDLSTVWMYADIYEKDLSSVKVGQEVVVSSTAYPGEKFTGRITFINPVLDDGSRIVKVRVEMANPGGVLKPNMFVDAVINTPLGESLVVPESSLLDTGTRQVVYVAQGEDTFAKRDVVVGKEAGGFIQILSGLQPGETVVTAATFLIDSQTQLGGFGGHGGHGGHGGSKSNQVPASTAPNTPAANTPIKQHPTAPAAQGDHSGHNGHSGH